jgi:hypothetical protein
MVKARGIFEYIKRRDKAHEDIQASVNIIQKVV